MMCICCDKTISLLFADDKVNEEDIVFKKEEKNSKLLTAAANECWLNGTIGFLSCGYGSSFDGDQIILALCDDCLEKKRNLGVIAGVGNYMSSADYIKELKEKWRLTWRRYNKLNKLLSII